MHYFVKMGNTWYATDFETLDTETIRDIQNHVEQGGVVMIGDDLEWLCAELNISLADVTII